MKVLVIGSGGREHALCWKIKESPLLTKLYCAPGNAGITSLAECVPIPADDVDALLKFANDLRIDLTIVGPEAPLVVGIVDAFNKAKLPIFGPTKAAAQLEGSKAFAKQFMKEQSIPTAQFGVYTDYKKAIIALAEYQYPLVIKVSGLAAGKGVIICQDRSHAELTLKEILLDHSFGDAGSKVVLEEYLQGEEASILAITDGERYFMLPPSQDHKRLLDGDLGPNTGGMGAVAPARVITPELLKRIEGDILLPTLIGMRERKTPFVGCLYLGLMICPDGPKLLEYNCRFGDPETQVVLPMVRSDLLKIFLATANGNLNPEKLEIWSKWGVCVVLASAGYPGKYQKGFPISGLTESSERIKIFHAGTALKDNLTVTNGGRVLGVTGFGFNLQSAINFAYQSVESIQFEGKTYRTDIAKKALKRPRKKQTTKPSDPRRFD